MSAFNIETYLNSLPEDIELIDVNGKGLDYLPDLSRFTNLKKLYCYNNQLVSLPFLPDSLQILWCSDNKLTSIHLLPNSIQILYCDNNQLVFLPLLPNSLGLLNINNNQFVSLPLLPDSLYGFWYSENPTFEIIFSFHINVVKKKIKIINQFRNLYYCIKYKRQFSKWLWDIREKKVKEEFHPDRLREMLEGKDIDDVDF